MELEKIFLLSIIAALIELDAYYIGMFLIAQPLIIGGITGYFLDNIYVGIIIGSVVQLIWINNPPVGAFVPPSTVTISFISTVYSIIFLKLLSNANQDAIFMFSLLIGIPSGYFVGQIDIWHRKLNTKIMHLFEDKIKQCKLLYLIIIQFLSIIIKILSNIILFLLIIVFGISLAEKIYLSLPLQLIRALTISFWIMPVVGLAVVFNMLYSKEGARSHGIAFFLSYFVFFLTNDKINLPFFINLIIILGFLISLYLVFKGERKLNEKN
ncbi:MAG: PTS sugar transporter subunit IIC [Candidatus Goldbacteria bacterium]|nr:PTS sugar transporter subunit IIC [Candidatus Goldiibacteriota bacterium]